LNAAESGVQHKPNADGSHMSELHDKLFLLKFDFVASGFKKIVLF